MEEQVILPKEKQTTLWIMWGAMLMSVVMFTGIGLYIRLSVGAPPKMSSYQNTLLYIWVGVAVLVTIVVFLVLPNIFAKKVKSQDQLIEQYISFMTTCITMADAPVVLGLVSHFSGAEHWVLFAFSAWSLFLLLFFLPTDREFQSFQKRIQK